MGCRDHREGAVGDGARRCGGMDSREPGGRQGGRRTLRQGLLPSEVRSSHLADKYHFSINTESRAPQVQLHPSSPLLPLSRPSFDLLVRLCDPHSTLYRRPHLERHRRPTHLSLLHRHPTSSIGTFSLRKGKNGGQYGFCQFKSVEDATRIEEAFDTQKVLGGNMYVSVVN